MFARDEVGSVLMERIRSHHTHTARGWRSTAVCFQTCEKLIRVRRMGSLAIGSGDEI